MTETMNELTKATATLQNKSRVVGYKKGIAAVNLAAEFQARGVSVQHGQMEK